MLCDSKLYIHLRLRVCFFSQFYSTLYSFTQMRPENKRRPILNVRCEVKVTADYLQTLTETGRYTAGRTMTRIVTNASDHLTTVMWHKYLTTADTEHNGIVQRAKDIGWRRCWEVSCKTQGHDLESAANFETCSVTERGTEYHHCLHGFVRVAVSVRICAVVDDMVLPPQTLQLSDSVSFQLSDMVRTAYHSIFILFWGLPAGCRFANSALLAAVQLPGLSSVHHAVPVCLIFCSGENIGDQSYKHIRNVIIIFFLWNINNW